MIAATIPAELRDAPRWVCWTDRDRDGKPTKIPLRPDGSGPAKSNDPATWGSFDVATATAESRSLAGIGFMLGDGIVGIDLDGCRDPDTGAIAPWADEIVRFIGSYAEISPSRTGIKIFCRGVLPMDRGRKVAVPNVPRMCVKEPAIEVYSQLRFFAVTGFAVGGYSLIDPGKKLANLCEEYFPPEIVPQASPTRPATSVADRAAKYVAKLEPAIAGQGGHNATFHAACVLIIGFELSEDEAYPILCEFNARCQPPWSERELRHKLRSAAKQPGPRGQLRDATNEQWQTIRLPKYTEPPLPPEPVTKVITLADAAAGYLDSIRGGHQALVRLGVADLDYAIGGGAAFGEVVVLAARPSHGKSAVALQALHHASRDGHPCLIISEEMSTNMLGKRTVQFVSEIPEEDWMRGEDGVKADLADHFAKRAPIYIAENCRSSDRAVATIEHYATEHGVKVVAVDYAQLLQSKGRDRYQQVTETSIAIRGVTSRLGIVTLFLCQLNREIEGRESFVPRASDLKESGQLEQDADVIAFLVWPWKLDASKPKSEYQIFVQKNRNRAINRPAFTCLFDPERQRVSNEKRRHNFGEYGEQATDEDA